MLVLPALENSAGENLLEPADVDWVLRSNCHLDHVSLRREISIAGLVVEGRGAPICGGGVDLREPVEEFDLRCFQLEGSLFRADFDFKISVSTPKTCVLDEVMDLGLPCPAAGAWIIRQFFDEGNDIAFLLLSKVVPRSPLEFLSGPPVTASVGVFLFDWGEFISLM